MTPYTYENSAIRCTVKDGRPTNIRLMVNHVWRRAMLVRKYRDLVLFSYDYNDTECFQEWRATVDGGYEHMKSFGARMPKYWGVWIDWEQG
jgi:hypothetical protein